MDGDQSTIGAPDPYGEGYLNYTGHNPYEFGTSAWYDWESGRDDARREKD